jgi:type VI secretion system secreted protein Hcp
MTIKGKVQGDITLEASTEKSVGSIWQKGHENEVYIQALNHQVLIPTETHSGMVTGERVHRELVITKLFDKSSPLLYKAMCENEELEVEIKWYRASEKSGGLEHYFTHKMEEAKIVDIKAYMPNLQDPKNAPFTHLEDVAFRYKAINWSHLQASTDHLDRWEA